MNISQILFGPKINHRDIWITDSGTTHVIFKDQKYFFYLYKCTVRCSSIQYINYGYQISCQIFVKETVVNSNSLEIT